MTRKVIMIFFVGGGFSTLEFLSHFRTLPTIASNPIVMHQQH